MLQIITTQEAFEKLINDAVILAVNNIISNDLFKKALYNKILEEKKSENVRFCDVFEVRTINGLAKFAQYEKLDIDFSGSINQLDGINLRKFIRVKNVGHYTLKELKRVLKEYNIKSTD